MAVDIPKASIIACICEGGAETVIMDILLDNNLLIFDREQLIDESERTGCSVIGVQTVPEDQTHRYGARTQFKQLLGVGVLYTF